MAYKTSDLRQKAIEAIKKHNLVFFEDIFAYIGIAKSTFYEHFPNESDGYNELSSLLDENKIRLKNSLRKKWHDCDNPTGWKHLYSLIGTDKEVERLHGSRQTQVHEGKIGLTVSSETAESVEDILNPDSSS
jgi:AcrR family transcriptional regulator